MFLSTDVWIICLVGIVVVGFLCLFLVSPVYETIAKIFKTDKRKYRIHKDKIESYRDQPYEFRVLSDMIADGTIQIDISAVNTTEAHKIQKDEERSIKICFKKYTLTYDTPKREVKQRKKTVMKQLKQNFAEGAIQGGYDYEVHDSLTDQHEQNIILDLTLYDQRLTLVCLYGYNTDKPELHCDMLHKTMRFSNTSFIFCGDWDVVQDNNCDTYNVIHDRNPNSRLHVTFSKLDSIVTENNSDKNFVRWKSEQKSEYVDRIHNDPEGILATVMNKLDELSVNNDATQNDINNIVLDISKNFKNAAAETFGKIKKHKHFYKHENSKPWFNRKCSMSRKKFHKARKRYSFLKNAENRRKMRQASKEHKITLNKSFANCQQKAADELRSISKKDTKALWKILNNLNSSKKKDSNDDISLKALYDHFKILNENVEPTNDFEQDFDFDTLSDDVELF
ncbi:unnamed protein product [Mytilus coruscus]|uniref:Uncharacterized protein n=1 Tax=Mytilus coruscus TaxID=42192 RepID=A0A6J8F378_MYTCO|nr:unnamed protein product [Mytilus coruscus]